MWTRKIQSPAVALCVGLSHRVTTNDVGVRPRLGDVQLSSQQQRGLGHSLVSTTAQLVLAAVA